MADHDLMTRREVATELGISARMVLYHIRRGQIEASQIGGWNWVISRSEIARIRETDWYKASQKTPASD